MIELLTANPWPLAVALAILAGFFLHHFRRTGRPRSAILALVLLLLIAGVFAADYFIQAPSEEVEHLLSQLVEAARSQAPQPIIDAVSANYNHEGKTYAQVATLIQSRIGDYKPNLLQLNGLEVDASGDRAEAKFVAITSGTYQGYTVNRYALRLRLEFRKEDGRWKIIAIDRYEVVGGSGEKIPIDRLR